METDIPTNGVEREVGVPTPVRSELGVNVKPMVATFDGYTESRDRDFKDVGKHSTVNSHLSIMQRNSVGVDVREKDANGLSRVSPIAGNDETIGMEHHGRGEADAATPSC